MLVYRIVVCTILVSFSICVNAQPLAKIYGALNAGDYERARIYLAKTKQPSNAAIAFAWARYYFESDNPKHQLDSAKNYVVKSQRYLPLIEKPQDIKRNNALGVRSHYINDLNDRINAQAFNRALVWNTVGDWNYFLTAYPDAAQFQEARMRRNQLAFTQAKESSNPNQLQQFFTDYPDASEADEARSLYEQLLYVQHTGDSTWHAYKRFMDENPESPYFKSAQANYERLLYKDLTKSNTADAYASFINAYPESPYRHQAEDSLYVRYSKPVAFVSKLTQFIQR